MGYGPADIVGRIFDIQGGSRTVRNLPYGYGPNGFVLTPASTAAEAKDVDVPGVVLRASTRHRTFDIVRKDLPVWVGDIIKAAPDTTLAIELFVGARLGVKRGAAVKLFNPSEAMTLDDGEWRRIMVVQGGVWAKFDKRERPLTIQTSGGVLGIKG